MFVLSDGLDLNGGFFWRARFGGCYSRYARPKSVKEEPQDDRKFQFIIKSGKSGILLGIELNPKKCKGVKVILIPKIIK